MSQRPPVAICKSCSDPIIWARTEAGRRMPVDAEPVPNGNIELVGGPVPTAIVRPGQTTAAAATGVPLRTSHFATCPRADKHRRRIDDSRRAREAKRLQQRTGQTDLFEPGSS